MLVCNYTNRLESIEIYGFKLDVVSWQERGRLFVE